MELFDKTACETINGDVRRTLRRNPIGVRELAETRSDEAGINQGTGRVDFFDVKQ